MLLFIDTTIKDKIFLALAIDEKSLHDKKYFLARSIAAKYDHAEKLLPRIDELCRKAGIKPENLKKILVNNKNGGFTALRIGVITANALGFALGRQVKSFSQNDGIKAGSNGSKKYCIIKPEYDREPNITKKSGFPPARE